MKTQKDYKEPISGIGYNITTEIAPDRNSVWIFIYCPVKRYGQGLWVWSFGHKYPELHRVESKGINFGYFETQSEAINYATMQLQQWFINNLKNNVNE